MAVEQWRFNQEALAKQMASQRKKLEAELKTIASGMTHCSIPPPPFCTAPPTPFCTAPPPSLPHRHSYLRARPTLPNPAQLHRVRCLFIQNGRQAAPRTSRFEGTGRR